MEDNPLIINLNEDSDLTFSVLVKTLSYIIEDKLF